MTEINKIINININGISNNIGNLNINYNITYYNLLEKIIKEFFPDKYIIEFDCIISTYKLPFILHYESTLTLLELLKLNNVNYTLENIELLIIIKDINIETIKIFKKLILIHDKSNTLGEYNKKIYPILLDYIEHRQNIISLYEVKILIHFKNSIILLLPIIFRKDKSCVLELCKLYGNIYKYINIPLKNDIEIINAAINSNSLILEYIDIKLIDNSLVEKAISENSKAIKYVPKYLITKDIILQAISNYDNLKYKNLKYNDFKNIYIFRESYDIGTYIPEIIIDKEIILKLLKINNNKILSILYNSNNKLLFDEEIAIYERNNIKIRNSYL